MSFTGKTLDMMILGRSIRFHNQRCRDWTHPYPYQGEGNLSNSGCGIFSLCHAAQWLTGNIPDVEALADFSVHEGGRGDDGTDRPALLHALMRAKANIPLGFAYAEDGLRNDLETLYAHISSGCGAALCNLRVGHIVTLVAAREKDGSRELLAIDSCGESSAEKVRDHVCAVVPGTEIHIAVKNSNGLCVGETQCYAAFWVEASLPRDFNLLHAMSPAILGI